MKKIVKKTLSVLAVLVMAASIAGCAESKTCSVCKKSYSKGGATQTILGQEVNVCDDCLKAANPFA